MHKQHKELITKDVIIYTTLALTMILYSCGTQKQKIAFEPRYPP